MEKVKIKDLFCNLQEQMEHRLLSNKRNIKHPVSKGDAHELNWMNWLEEYLPKRYSFNKAFIVDSNGNISEQIDIVIYDKQYSPFVFNQDNTFYIPAESVYAVFEVKSEICKNHIEYAGEKCKSVRSLFRTSASIPYVRGVYGPKKLHKIISGILTLSSDWNPPLGNSFQECLSSLDEDSRIDIGCVLDSGSFTVDYDEKINVIKSSKEEAMVFFFLKLFGLLQRVGTVPAIDICCYEKSLDYFKSNF
jgi:hypothetical protein